MIDLLTLHPFIEEGLNAVYAACLDYAGDGRVEESLEALYRHKAFRDMPGEWRSRVHHRAFLMVQFAATGRRVYKPDPAFAAAVADVDPGPIAMREAFDGESSDFYVDLSGLESEVAWPDPEPWSPMPYRATGIYLMNIGSCRYSVLNVAIATLFNGQAQMWPHELSPLIDHEVEIRGRLDIDEFCDLQAWRMSMLLRPLTPSPLDWYEPHVHEILTEEHMAEIGRMMRIALNTLIYARSYPQDVIPIGGTRPPAAPGSEERPRSGKSADRAKHYASMALVGRDHERTIAAEARAKPAPRRRPHRGRRHWAREKTGPKWSDTRRRLILPDLPDGGSERD